MVSVDRTLCDQCGICVKSCPFGAVSITNDYPWITENCKLCNACIRACPRGALRGSEGKQKKSEGYRGVLVFLEQESGQLHPVSLEMTGKAKELLRTCGGPLYGFMAGCGLEKLADDLLIYGFDTVELYEDESLNHFTASAYADAFVDCVRRLRPSIVLVGATPIGRCLAPLAATDLRTGVTADCTSLSVDADGGLRQTRPAFGGNVMARILTPNTRPQFATVRYKVMDAAVREENSHGVVRKRPMPARRNVADIIVERVTPTERSDSICDAKVIVAAGRGLSGKKDLDMIRRLAELLGGTYAVSRPLVEAGWARQQRQIGLSGRSVKPELIITAGISGAVQFATAIAGAGLIIAIDKNPEAAIMKTAHIGVVGDLYEIIPNLIARLEERVGQSHETIVRA